MKRILAALLLISVVICFSSCMSNNSSENKANQLIELPKDATLHIGNSVAITNTIHTTTEDVYLEYVSNVTYSLRRVYKYGSVPDNYFQESAESRYYYYWDVSTTNEQMLLGQRTSTIENIYSYLPYADGESVMVKLTTKTSNSYTYTSAFIDKEITYNIDLNGYFSSIEDVKLALPDLANWAHVGNTSDRYYVNTDTSTKVASSTNTYTNTYYFITYQTPEAEATT